MFINVDFNNVYKVYFYVRYHISFEDFSLKNVIPFGRTQLILPYISKVKRQSKMVFTACKIKTCKTAWWHRYDKF